MIVTAAGRRCRMAAAGGGGGGSFFGANRFVGYTGETDFPFTVSRPAGAPADRSVPGTDFGIIYDGSEIVSDGTKWRYNWAAGTHGTPLPDPGGWGIGNIYTVACNGAHRIYGYERFALSANYIVHRVSNKRWNIEYHDGSNYNQALLQLYEGGYWFHCEDLGAGFFGTPSDNTAPTLGAIVELEWELDARTPASTRFRAWLDGTLKTDEVYSSSIDHFTGIGHYAFRGGGGEGTPYDCESNGCYAAPPLAADIYYDMYRLYLAWS